MLYGIKPIYMYLNNKMVSLAIHAGYEGGNTAEIQNT